MTRHRLLFRVLSMAMAFVLLFSSADIVEWTVSRSAAAALAEPSIVLNVSPTSFVVGENCFISFDAPDADKVEILAQFENEGEGVFQTWVPGDTQGWSWGIDAAQTVNFRARALFGEQWVYSDSVEVTIDAPHGRLNAPEITAPASVAIGEPLEISVAPVEYADTYDLYVYANCTAPHKLDK